VSVEDRKYK